MFLNITYQNPLSRRGIELLMKCMKSLTTKFTIYVENRSALVTVDGKFN